MDSATVSTTDSANDCAGNAFGMQLFTSPALPQQAISCRARARVAKSRRDLSSGVDGFCSLVGSGRSLDEVPSEDVEDAGGRGQHASEEGQVRQAPIEQLLAMLVVGMVRIRQAASAGQLFDVFGLCPLQRHVASNARVSRHDQRRADAEAGQITHASHGRRQHDGRQHSHSMASAREAVQDSYVADGSKPARLLFRTWSCSDREALATHR
eukprot:scaffold964_cov261-Pinguiococcus_pyrenoidosus.AAC.10